jgi:hypothetical protein
MHALLASAPFSFTPSLNGPSPQFVIANKLALHLTSVTMWRFTEKFMEECVEANPSAFIHAGLEKYQRQLRINGFRPDLLLKDTDGKIVIIEIQQQALDRYHLYKTLEYRDIVPEHLNTEVSEVVLICERIDDRYRRLLQTHNVRLSVFDRATFIDIAIKECPEVVQRFLTDDQNEEASSDAEQAPTDLTKIRFRPLKWHSHLSPHDVLQHLHEEFGRLGISVERLPREWYRQIYYDVWFFLERESLSAIRELLIPNNWNFEKLYERGKHVQAVYLNDWRKIAKPRIHLFAEITIKHNFRVFWYPTEFGRSFDRTENNDWLNWCGDASYGWSRPQNELLFIRDVTHLSPGVDDSMRWDDRLNWDVLDEIFVGLIHSCYAYLIQILSSCLDVKVHTGIEIKTKAQPDGHKWSEGERICGWSLFSYAARERELEQQWLSTFKQEYGLSIEDLLQVYKTSTEKRNRGHGNLARYTSRDLARRNIKLTEGQITAIIDRLSKHHSYLLTRLENITHPPSAQR